MTASTAVVPADPNGLAHRTRIARDVQDALAKLAAHGSADQIALALTEAGHRGVRHSSMGCPVAEYLTDETGALFMVSTSSADPFTGLGAEITVPAPVASFVRSFDRGQYPDLTWLPATERLAALPDTADPG